MHVYFKRYKLTPLKALNRLSGITPRFGVHLKIKTRRNENFADYFPHPELGDRIADQFLEEFKYQDQEYEQKVFEIQLHEDKLRSSPLKVFFNHELWDGKSEIKAKTIKYKLKDEKDYSFLGALSQKIKCRLDANGLFNAKTITEFEKGIPHHLKDHIEYLEDPMKEPDWSASSLTLAQDFIPGSPFKFIVHKPNRGFAPLGETPIIFSSNLGSDLGLWHSYLELIMQGNLSLIHGLITPGFYQEEKLKFTGNYSQGFIPDKKTVKTMYDELSAGDWKLLCSI